MGAVKSLYMDAQINLEEELRREPTEAEIEDRVRLLMAKIRKEKEHGQK